MFDTALIESAHPVRDGRRARSLPFAVGLHAAVLAGLILSAILSTGEPPEPQLPIIFPAFFGGPPPPQGDGTPVVSRTLRSNPVTVRHEPQSQPVRIPVDLPAVVADAPPGHESAGEDQIGDGVGESEVGSGSPLGAPGGTGDALTLPGAGRRDEILIPGVNGVLPPVLIRRVEPEYPEAARRLHMEGVCILRAVITASGAVEELQVVKSAGALLDAAAVAAVRRWSYTPATRDKRAVPVYLDVTVSFALRG